MSETRDFIVEIGTEELPPVALSKLSLAFENNILQEFTALGFEKLGSQRFASPRRLAVRVNSLPVQQEDQLIERRGPSLQAAFDKDNKPTQAANGFARSCGVTVDELERLETKKGIFLFHKKMQSGLMISERIADIVNKALAGLPIPKRMRWGSGAAEFVRPVHWVLLLFGEEIIEANILGVNSGNTTKGHRFHHPESIAISSPAEYEERLHKQGRVIADFAVRRKSIEMQVQTMAAQSDREVDLQANADLLDEVTALVEWPVAVECDFEDHFLQVPAEALVSTMKSNQKYFPLYDRSGKLTSRFIVISNLQSTDPEKVKQGNERVIRPRLADAAFFWEQDRRQPLQSYNERLKSVVFQSKLGSVYDKASRVAKSSRRIAEQLGVDAESAERAGLLCKADLMTEMVGEFPKLQGIMGCYYARHSQESEDTAVAIEEHYLPRFAGDRLPQSASGQCVALADKMDTLVGIFAVGQKPTGEKDPFALRRAALGVLKIILDGGLKLDLLALLQQSAQHFEAAVGAGEVVDDVFEFIMTRLRAEYEGNPALGFTPQQIDAVMACKPAQPLDFDRRIKAVRAFASLPEAESLSAANKRIGNLLKKSAQLKQVEVDTKLLQEPAEQALYAAMQKLLPEVEPLCAAGEYEQALIKLAALRTTIDAFFDSVLVMADDEKLQKNRLALLATIHNSFAKIADIACLQN